jgi:hypothetical protein
MRRVFLIAITAATLAACSSSPSSHPGTASIGTQPDGSVPAPGNCVPEQTLPDVTLVVEGKKFSPTFGIGTSECTTLTGRGYIAFDYDPVLIDASGPVEIVVDGNAKVTSSWPAGEPFTQPSAGHWRSGTPATGCTRLTVNVVSPSGGSSETVGADIRVGGSGVVCAQRGLGPSEPIDTSVIITEAPDTTIAKTRPGKTGDTTTTANTNP